VATEQNVPLDQTGIRVFRDITFVAAGPANEFNRNALSVRLIPIIFVGPCLTTFPLADVYDRLLDRPGMPLAVQIAIPILIEALIYLVIGAMLGWILWRYVVIKFQN
jgi:hypothetical protein